MKKRHLANAGKTNPKQTQTNPNKAKLKPISCSAPRPTLDTRWTTNEPPDPADTSKKSSTKTLTLPIEITNGKH